MKSTRTASRTITDESGKRSFYLGNHNALLSMMPEALSGKTGFTGNAGYCYVVAEKDDKGVYRGFAGAAGLPIRHINGKICEKSQDLPSTVTIIMKYLKRIRPFPR